MIRSYNANTESFFKNVKLLLKIQDILTLQTLKIYHKFRNNKLPYYMVPTKLAVVPKFKHS